MNYFLIIPLASLLNDNSAIIISLLSALFTALGLILNYRLRKKDFQSLIFIKQFAAYSELVETITKISDEIIKYYNDNWDSDSLNQRDFQAFLQSKKEEILKSLNPKIHYLHKDIIDILIQYSKLLSDFPDLSNENFGIQSLNVIKYLSQLRTSVDIFTNRIENILPLMNYPMIHLS